MNALLKYPLCLTLASLLAGACTDIETIDRKVLGPEDQDPALYAAYLEALGEYKSSDHYLTYARMDNAPEVSTSPKDFIDILPDSLDFIALRRPLSQFDAADLAGVKRKGTKVLAWADGTAAEGMQTLDGALEQVAAYDLDGLVVSGAIPAASMNKLTALEGKMLLFEGDPARVASGARDKIDLYILDATNMGNVYDLRLEVDYILDRLGIEASRLLLATNTTATLNDTQLKPQPALALVAACAMAYGPLAGVAVFDVKDDYYDPNMSYPRTREAITFLNPKAN